MGFVEDGEGLLEGSPSSPRWVMLPRRWGRGVGGRRNMELFRDRDPLAGQTVVLTAVVPTSIEAQRFTVLMMGSIAFMQSTLSSMPDD